MRRDGQQETVPTVATVCSVSKCCPRKLWLGSSPEIHGILQNGIEGVRVSDVTFQEGEMYVLLESTCSPPLYFPTDYLIPCACVLTVCAANSDIKTSIFCKC